MQRRARLMGIAALPVFLVHYDAVDWVRSAAESIQASDVPVDLTIVSNSGAVEVPGAKIIVTDGNLGYAGGGNVAFRQWLSGSAPFAVVGSHDLHVERNALRLVRAAMEADESIGIAAPWMPDASVGPERDGGLAWLSGQGLMYRRECIEAIGGFDERFRSYTEDQDIGLRAWDAGWRVVRVDAAVGHGMGSSIGSRAARREFWPNHVALAFKRGGLRGATKALLLHGKAILIELRLTVTDRTNRSDHLQRAVDRVMCTPRCIVQVARFARSG